MVATKMPRIVEREKNQLKIRQLRLEERAVLVVLDEVHLNESRQQLHQVKLYGVRVDDLCESRTQLCSLFVSECITTENRKKRRNKNQLKDADVLVQEFNVNFDILYLCILCPFCNWACSSIKHGLQCFSILGLITISFDSFNSFHLSAIEY